jgi:hypothetical protein
MEGAMSKNRQFLSLGMVIVFVAAGFFVSRSQAQPEQLQRADLPFLWRIGEKYFNPSKVMSVHTFTLYGKKYLQIDGGELRPFEFGTNGEAEALLEWFDAHSTELKPKPVKRK